MKVTTHWLSFENTNRVGIYLVQWLDLSSVGVTQEISLMLASSVDSFVFLNPFCIQYAPPVFAWDIFMVRAQVLSIMATSQKGNCCFFVFRFCFSCWLLEVVSFMCSSVFHSPWEKLRLYIFFFPAWLPLWNKVYLMPYSGSVLCSYLWFLARVCDRERADAAGLNDPV